MYAVWKSQTYTVDKYDLLLTSKAHSRLHYPFILPPRSRETH